MTRVAQFPCPRCGYAYSRATTTTKARSGVDTRRQRTCERATCRAGFVTYEVSAADYEFLQAARRFMESRNAEKEDPPPQGRTDTDRRSMPRVRSEQPSSQNELGSSSEERDPRPPQA